MNIETAPTNFNDIYAYGENGTPIPRRFHARFQKYFAKNQPMYRTTEATQAVNADDDTTVSGSGYDGSESVLDVLNENNYKEQGELDAYLKWWTLDYTYTVSDVAISDFTPPDDDESDGIEYDTLVRDPRGYESIAQQFAADNDIVPVFNSKVRNVTFVNANLMHFSLFPICKSSLYWSLPSKQLFFSFCSLQISFFLSCLSQQVTDVIYDRNYTLKLNGTYKVLVRTYDTKTNGTCTNYLAQRAIITVPVA
jgi:hypothetical protein